MCKRSVQVVQNSTVFDVKECEQKSVQLAVSRLYREMGGLLAVLPTYIHMLYAQFMHQLFKPLTDEYGYLSPVSTAPISTNTYLKRRL